MSTAIVYSPEFIRHITPFDHPERPERVEAIVQTLKKSSLALVWLAPRRATVEEILLCHTPEYVKSVQSEVARLKQDEIRLLSTGDVTISSSSYEIALLAAGAVESCVDAVMNKEVQNGYCVVRPPGHHATRDRGLGFCLFNNVGIGVRYVQKRYGIKKVLIVDWDLHHGNGTQDIFYSDPSVVYFSTHQRGIYPGTGKKEEVGVGNIYNVEITPGPDSVKEIFYAIENRLAPIVEQFEPEFIFISAGFDAHKEDPLGQLYLTSDHYYALTQVVMGYAKKYADNRLVSVLEGGYNLGALADSSLKHVEALCHDLQKRV